MVSLLIHTVKTQSPELTFHAAVSLGRLCVVEPVRDIKSNVKERKLGVTMLTTANQRKENTTNCLENLKKMMGVTKLASHSGEGGGSSLFWGGGGAPKIMP